jgi:hypothetical protein
LALQQGLVQTLVEVEAQVRLEVAQKLAPQAVLQQAERAREVELALQEQARLRQQDLPERRARLVSRQVSAQGSGAQARQRVWVL